MEKIDEKIYDVMKKYRVSGDIGVHETEEAFWKRKIIELASKIEEHEELRNSKYLYLELTDRGKKEHDNYCEDVSVLRFEDSLPCDRCGVVGSYVLEEPVSPLGVCFDCFLYIFRDGDVKRIRGYEKKKKCFEEVRKEKEAM